MLLLMFIKINLYSKMLEVM